MHYGKGIGQRILLLRIEYGDCEFPSDSESLLSTFSTSSSTQKSSPIKSTTNSSNTPIFAELEGENETDMSADESCPITKPVNTDNKVIKCLIGDIS